MHPDNGPMTDDRLRQVYAWHGRHHIPRTGGAIVVVNHISKIDPITLGHFLRGCGRVPHFLAKVELWRYRPGAWLMDALGGIPIRRDRRCPWGDCAAKQTRSRRGYQGRVRHVGAAQAARCRHRPGPGREHRGREGRGRIVAVRQCIGRHHRAENGAAAHESHASRNASRGGSTPYASQDRKKIFFGFWPMEGINALSMWCNG